MTAKTTEALEYYRPPFTYISEGQTVQCNSAKGGGICLNIRGWGMLTGGGAHNLPADKAMALQDAFGQWVADSLNKALRQMQQPGTERVASPLGGYNA